MSGIKDVDSWRKFHLAIAEWVDAWRLIPRAVVMVFSYGTYKVIEWYMSLEPSMIAGCVEAGGKAAECISQAPTTQHTALLTALFGLAAAVFAFYSTNGRKWNGFSYWNKPDDKSSEMYWREGEDKPVKDERKAPRKPTEPVMEHSRGNGG